MRNIILVTIYCSIILSANAQIEKRFDYKKTPSGVYLVTSTFDNFKNDPKSLLKYQSDPIYVNSLISDLVKEVLTIEKIGKIHFSTGWIITFNSKGDVLSCKFSVNEEDRKTISEEDLYGLYIRFKKVKLDMTKIKIDSANNPLDGIETGYCEMGGTLIPKEYRDKLLNGKK